jgi:hypothetical protein
VIEFDRAGEGLGPRNEMLRLLIVATLADRTGLADVLLVAMNGLLFVQPWVPS